MIVTFLSCTSLAIVGLPFASVDLLLPYAFCLAQSPFQLDAMLAIPFIARTIFWFAKCYRVRIMSIRYTRRVFHLFLTV